jgi:hypothetical protein
VRRLVRSEVGLVAGILAGLLVTYIGIAVAVSGRDRFAGLLVLVAGAWATVAAPVLHDRQHRETGEPPHAIWGRDDRRRPSWWPRR